MIELETQPRRGTSVGNLVRITVKGIDLTHAFASRYEIDLVENADDGLLYLYTRLSTESIQSLTISLVQDIVQALRS